jgi:AcrR family transcriptional regulator
MVGSAPEMPEGDTKTRILAVALERFAEHGYAGTSLNEIADEVGIRRPSLLHHFPSKDALYRAVVLQSFDEWSALVGASIDGHQGWPQVEHILRTAFSYFETKPVFVRLARREALDGGPVLIEELGATLQPMFDAAVRFLDAEMDAGRIRRYDAAQLVITAYGAVLSYLSDTPLIQTLTGEDPLSPEALDARRDHVLEVLRNALVP